MMSMLEIVDMVDIFVTRLSYWFMMMMVVMLSVVEIVDMMGHMWGGWDCVANQFIYFMQKACLFFRFQSVISSKHVCAPCLFSTRRSWTMMLEFLYHSTIVDLSKMIFNMASIFITVKIIR